MNATDLDYDVIVVGGGPAGGTAAYYLARANRRVLVLEKQAIPRYKTCGGGLSLRMLEKYFPFSFDPVIEARPRVIEYVFGHRWVRVPLPEGALGMVMRDRFDAYLLQHSGAEVRCGQAVTAVRELDDRVVVHTSDGTELTAGFVIGADGFTSQVARSLGLRPHKKLVAAIEAEAPAPPEVLRRYTAGPVFIFGEIDLGYLWIFPKGDHLSVGIGGFHPKPGQLQETLRRVMAAHGIALDGVKLHGHSIPVYTRNEPIATRRALLVGDAAGLVDPLSGEGIRLAIKSGALAAQAILAGRPEQYQRLVWRRIGASQRLAWPLIPIFYRLTRAAFRLGVRNPLASRAFMDLLSDSVDYPGIYLRIFGTLPLFAVTELAAKLAGRRGAALRRRVYGPNASEADIRS